MYKLRILVCGVRRKMDKVFNILAKINGLLGVYANVGFGKTTFMLQVVEEINRRKNGTAIIFELEELKEHIQKRIKDLKIDNKRIILCDDSELTIEKIENYIQKVFGKNHNYITM